MPAELSESDARALLERAAATIDVEPAAPVTLTGLPEPRARHWPAAVAAAAAVLLVVTGAVLINRHRASAPDTTVTGPVVEHAYHYGRHRMPSLFGYTSAEAERLLEARGLRVRVAMEPTICNVPGQVLRADPPQGDPVSKGTVVHLSVAMDGNQTLPPPHGGTCGGEPGWRKVWGLIRFARGLGPAPAFADTVTARVRSDTTVLSSTTLSAASAARPGDWATCGHAGCHSALAGVAQMATALPERVNGIPPVPYINARYEDPCTPNAVPGSGLWLWQEIPTDGRFCPTSRVAITQDSHGRITGVTYYVPPSRAARQKPPAVDPVRAVAARRFVAWARGRRQPPSFAPRVRDLLAGQRYPRLPLWNNTPTNPRSWEECSGALLVRCQAGPLAAIRRQSGPLGVHGAGSLCAGEGILPKGYPPGPDLIVLAPRSSCPHMEVDLWIDAKGAIHAVDLVP